MHLLRWLGGAALRESLLPTPAARQDVEMASHGEATEPIAGIGRTLQVRVVPAGWWDYAVCMGLVVALVVPSVIIGAVVMDEWQNSPAQRGWLILGFSFYIAAGLQALWSLLLQTFEKILYLRVEVRKYAAQTLFEAITETLAAEAEQVGATCSWDQEAVQEHDKLTGKNAVKLRFWGSRARSMQICIRVPMLEQESEHQQFQLLNLQVAFQPGEDIVCGRDSRLERNEVLVLSVRSSSSRALQEKKLLARWMELSYEKFVKPEEDVVSVYALQESSSDWVPEWKFERVKPCKSSSSTGQSFFLKRGGDCVLNEMLADAKLWSQSSLRVYMITGPPGVGKSEFTIWIAGQLSLPVYRLSLSSGRLTDDRLAQLLSASSVKFNSVLVQVDEFQETVHRWMSSPASNNSGKVTPGGFCEVLQGSTAMSRGVVILTGTDEIAGESVEGHLPAVFRRINYVCKLSWMCTDEVRCFFRQFLMRFVPGCPADEWETCENMFMEGRCWSGDRPISIDMLKQYLMHQITKSSCLSHGEFVLATEHSDETVFQVKPEHRNTFFKLICSTQLAESFLNSYAPVHLICGSAFDAEEWGGVELGQVRVKAGKQPAPFKAAPTFLPVPKAKRSNACV